MTPPFEIGEKLPGLVRQMLAGYESDPVLRHIDRAVLPSRAETEEMIGYLLELMYPGFFGRQDLTRHNIPYHVGELLSRIGRLAYRQICKCLNCVEETGKLSPDTGVPRETRARTVTLDFLARLPVIRHALAGDVQAAFDGDPAALNTDEVVLAYPGTLAITIYRLAHGLHELGVPLLPRMMTEWGHAHTGIDIHPGAKVGQNFFIDHGTGVVIGETAVIGDNVKMYQGVTLGALSIPKDERGRAIRTTKRHPTVRDAVTLYANAIVLGGETVVGESSVIGGSVFVTSTVPANSTVSINPPELRVRDRTRREGKDGQRTWLPDYQI